MDVRKVLNPKDDAYEYAGQGAGNDNKGKGPGHPLFSNVSVHPAWNGNNIVNKVRGADRGAGKPEYAHLEREKEEGTRHHAHRSEEGDGKRNKDRNDWEDIDP